MERYCSDYFRASFSSYSGELVIDDIIVLLPARTHSRRSAGRSGRCYGVCPISRRSSSLMTLAKTEPRMSSRAYAGRSTNRLDRHADPERGYRGIIFSSTLPRRHWSPGWTPTTLGCRGDSRLSYVNYADAAWTSFASVNHVWSGSSRRPPATPGWSRTDRGSIRVVSGEHIDASDSSGSAFHHRGRRRISPSAG